MIARRHAVFLTQAKRSQPVLLNPAAYHETVRIKLPAGFKVDEMPDSLSVETPFGKYTAASEAKGGDLVFTRTLEVRLVTVPVAEYPAVRAFYDRILGAEQSPVVLVKP